MDQNSNYVKILLESLYKKCNILDEIIKLNNEQSKLVVDIKKNMVEYEATIESKQLLIDELNLLDDGFQAIYIRVKDVLTNCSDEYADEIREMKAVISDITDKSVEIQTGEEKNRQIISQQFALIRKEVKDFKDNKKVANQYYSNMQKLSYVSPQFMDKKK